MQQLLTLMKHCECGITLTINDHKDMCQTVRQYCEEWNGWHDETHTKADQIPEETIQAMEKADCVVCLQYYPMTPVGFHRIYGDSVVDVLKMAAKLLHFCEECNGTGECYNNADEIPGVVCFEVCHKCKGTGICK